MTDEPKGVIAIWTDPDGRVVATEADFDRSGFGGFETWDAQRIRCERQISRKAIRAYCSPAVTDALSAYLVDQIANEMQLKGHKVSYRAVGWPTEVHEAMQRR